MDQQLTISARFQKVRLTTIAACICLLVCLLGFNQLKAQPSGLQAAVFEFANQARTKPTQFLAEHEAYFAILKPAYINVLRNAEPVPALDWDESLAQMAEMEYNDDPKKGYYGNNDLCTFVTGQTGYPWPRNNALFYLGSFYRYLHDEAYSHIGFHASDKAFIFSLGQKCGAAGLSYRFEGVLDTANIDFGVLDTGAGKSYLSDNEKMMIREINFVRRYPRVYAAIIGLQLENESGLRNGLSRRTVYATLELMDRLENSEPASILQPKSCLQRAARQHADDLKRSGVFSHTGSDYSRPHQRIQKHCRGLRGSENLVGGNSGVRGLIIQLLDSPGHRDNLLDPDWQYVACSGYAREQDESPQKIPYMVFVQKFAFEKRK